MGKRPLVYGGIAAGLILVAAAVIPKTFPFARGDSDEGFATPEAPFFVDTVIVGLVLVSIVIAIYLRLRVASVYDPTEHRRKPVWHQIVVVLIVFWSAAFIASKLRDANDGSTRPGVSREEDAPGGTSENNDVSRSRALGLMLTVGLAIVVVAGGAGVFLMSRPEGTSVAPDEMADQISDALDVSAVALRDSSDPRAAVIACYGRLERILRACGVPIKTSDTPHEILGAALDSLEVSAAAAARLTALFESARYSHHETDEEMREEALAALKDVAAELEARWASV
jgi:flagellar basal body-associated protein FliL